MTILNNYFTFLLNLRLKYVFMVRKYFGTDGVRARANTNPLTADFTLKLGIAIGIILKKKDIKPMVVIGKDTRVSCYMLESALTAGLNAVGAGVYLIGPIPTPGIAMLVRSMRCDLGIMISASHNPYYDNGIKLFDSKGKKFPDDIEEEIENIIDNPDLFNNYVINENIGRAWRSDNNIYQQRYIEYVKHTFPKDLDLDGLKIVLDCANGAAYKVAPTVFQELGAEIVKIIGCEPNGININHNCGSTKPEILQQEVINNKADLGIALDGDADRIIMVNEKGELIDGDKIIALVATKMLNENSLNKNTVVTTVMSNLGLELYFDKIGIKLIRTRVGDRYVAEEMRNNGYNLGGEQSGHIILGDYSTTGDGICCGLQVMAIMQQNKHKTISQLTEVYETVPQILENIKYEKNQQNPLELQEVIDYIDVYEKLLAGKGRILIRKSGTEPLIRVMVECNDSKLLTKVVNDLVTKIKEYL